MIPKEKVRMDLSLFLDVEGVCLVVVCVWAVETVSEEGVDV